MSKRQRRSTVAQNSNNRNKNSNNNNNSNSNSNSTSNTNTSTSNATATTTTTASFSNTTATNNPTDVAKLKRRIIEKVLSHKRRNGNDAFNLDLLVDGWLELESDPGTFSLLIEDFGCFGAQVDEVYDLEQKFEGPVYGFIFLFKWLNNQQSERSLRNQSKSYDDPRPTDTITSTIICPTTSTVSNTSNYDTNANNSNNGRSSNQNQSSRDKCQQQQQQQHEPHPWSYVVDENIISEIFFAKQMISNSCATHALISVLLNCDRNELNLGPILTRLRDHTKVMNPENKGYAIGNLPELAKAHNSHASYSSLYCRDRPQQRGVSFVIRGNQRTNLQQLQNQPETYHFVSYVPIKNRLYELDGLKNYPIDHGPIDPNEDWTEKFRSVIKQRLLDNKSGSDDPMNEIRYNLMAVVPDKRVHLKAQLKKLERHLKSTQDVLKQLNTIGCSANSQDNTCSHRTTSTMVDIQNDALFRPSSPVSNGTLTASETGSLCNSPKHSSVGDIHPYTGDIEIPNPPYSPLSNDTLSASETGSVSGSPSRFEDSFIYDEHDKIEKYFFIKFDPSNLAYHNEPKREAVAAEKIPTLAATIESSTTSSAVTCRKDHDQKLSALDDLQRLSKQLQRDIEKNESLLKEEYDKRRKYKIDNSRRTHNYEPFIMTFLSMLAKQGNLADLIEKDLGLISEETTMTQQHEATASHRSKPSSAPPLATPKLSSTSTPKHKQQASTAASTSQPAANQERPQRQKPKNYKYVSTGRPRGRPRKVPPPG